MEKSTEEIICKTIIHDTSTHALNFSIFPHRLVANAYVGCQHSCRYCYALWCSKKGQVTVKVNSPQRLKEELQIRLAENKPREPVCLGSISDPYQPIEKYYRITRNMLEVFDTLRYPTFIVTKSDLVLRDLDILQSLAKDNLVAVNFTVTALDNSLLSRLEPYALKNDRRLNAIRLLSEEGIRCSIYLSPILPFLSEPYIEDLIVRAGEVGARCCSAIFLKVRPIVWKHFKEFLLENRPALLSAYELLYFKKGEKDLSKYWLPEHSYRRSMMEKIAKISAENGLKFTSEEFFDLWTTPLSDCVDIDCWHATTMYDVWMKKGLWQVRLSDSTAKTP